MNRYEKGKKGEDCACRYLEENGYTVLKRNYRGGRGEIDIVAKTGNTLVFVEVKAWKTIPISEAGFSIGKVKQGRMLSAVKQYIFENSSCISDPDIRFDFIFIGTANGKLNHCRNVLLENG